MSLTIHIGGAQGYEQSNIPLNLHTGFLHAQEIVEMYKITIKKITIKNIRRMIAMMFATEVLIKCINHESVSGWNTLQSFKVQSVKCNESKRCIFCFCVAIQLCDNLCLFITFIFGHLIRRDISLNLHNLHGLKFQISSEMFVYTLFNYTILKSAVGISHWTFSIIHVTFLFKLHEKWLSHSLAKKCSLFI